MKNDYPEFVLHCKALKLPAPVAEYRFHPLRKWRFDFCWIAPLSVALEVEGGVWVSGRHTRGSGFVKDMEKYNEAGKLGYRIFRFTPQEMKSGKAANFMRDIFLN